MRFLVTGATGLLGSKIVEYLKSKEYKAYGTCFSNKVPSFVRLDIKNSDEVKKVIEKIMPEIIIHSAAIVNPDYCEENKEDTYKTNVIGTQNIIDTAEKIGAKLVYISTDAVFDNSDRAYSEEDETSPINYYAETKRMGETAVENSDTEWIISRITGLYGHSKYFHKISFPEWIIRGIKNNEQLRVVDGMKAHPTLVDDTSRVILELLKMNKTGIFHMTGPDYITRLEFAYKVCDIFNLDKSKIIPVEQEEIGFKARRGENLHMSLKKLNSLGIHTLGVEEGLKIMREQMKDG